MAAGGTVFGLGNCMDVPFLPFGTLHDAKPHYGPSSPPRWGRFFCLANLFSSEYPWIQPRLFQFARRLRKAASGRAWPNRLSCRASLPARLRGFISHCPDERDL
jgi:hypothetical protein